MSFNEAWRAFFETRINDLGADIMNDPEYKRCADNTHRQFNSLRESLPPEAREKFEKFDESMTEKQGVCEDFHYMAGLRDGLALSQWLIIHEGPNDGNDYLSESLGAHLHLVAEIARVED